MCSCFFFLFFSLNEYQLHFITELNQFPDGKGESVSRRKQEIDELLRTKPDAFETHWHSELKDMSQSSLKLQLI